MCAVRFILISLFFISCAPMPRYYNHRFRRGYPTHIVGIASYYADDFDGKPTASGEIFDMNKLTAAHKELPLGTIARITNPANGLSVVVKINDRGPFIPGREIDISKGAAEKIGLIDKGTATVLIDVLELP